MFSKHIIIDTIAKETQYVAKQGFKIPSYQTENRQKVRYLNLISNPIIKNWDIYISIAYKAYIYSPQMLKSTMNDLQWISVLG